MRADNFIGCVFLPRYITSGGYTHSVRRLLGSKTCGVGSRGGWLPALWAAAAAKASLPEDSLRGGGLHQHFSRCWPRFCRGWVAAALVGFTDGSGWGNGDGRVPIFFLTHQIQRPLSGIGNPLCGFFPPGRGLDAPPVFLQRGWCEGRRWGFAPSIAPVWGAVEVVTRTVAKLNIEWPTEKRAEPQKSKLDERFLRSKPPPPHRGLPFFPDLHTEVSRLWARPFWFVSPCHQRLTLSDMKEKDRVFLMDAPLAPSDRYQEARKQAAAFQRFLPHGSLALGAAGREQPSPCTNSSYREAQKKSVASRAPLQRDREQRRSRSGTSKPKPGLSSG